MGEGKSKGSKGLVVPRPFLKWVGGKGSLLPELMERVELAGDFGRYHEPFLGGGALFIHLYREGRLKRQAWLSDVNPRLMETYAAVRDTVVNVVDQLNSMKVWRYNALDKSKEYYRIRAYGEHRSYMKHPWNRAARFIYLNKTCYNGLYRENAKGEFNAPIGTYKNPTICDEENLLAASVALKKKAKLFCGHFSDVLDRAQPGDLVYLDPPYVPISQTASFTCYHAGGFGLGQHQILAYVFRRLDEKLVKVLLSNSDTELVRDLYRGFVVDEVSGNRSVSCKGDGRGKVRDLLIRNF